MKKLLAMALALVLVLGFTAAAYAAYDNPYGTTPSTSVPAPGKTFTSVLQDGDTRDNGVGNANGSGGNVTNTDISAVSTTVYDARNIIKSKDMRLTKVTVDAQVYQRTHGAYQNNTNSCASCHQTHTGASKDLLIKQGVYNTCSACHDGTLGFYNVFSPSTAGTFAGTKAGNASVHLATGQGVFINMAPGYKDYSGEPSNKLMSSDNFDCAACHAPHGSYSDRLLHYSPAGMADIAVEKKGNKLANIYVATASSEFAAKKKTDVFLKIDYVLYRDTAANIDAAYKDEKGNSFMTTTGITDGTKTVLVVLKSRDNGVTWKWDNNPWVAGYEHAMNDTYGVIKMFYYTQMSGASGVINPFDAGGKFNGKLDINYGGGFALGTSVSDVVYADISRAYVVKLRQNVLGSFGGINVTAVNPDTYDDPGTGLAISSYCGACHTDYMTHSGDRANYGSAAEAPLSGGTGVFRHSTDKDRFNCLKCHYAHGTDVTVMKDARDRDLAYLTKPVAEGGGGFVEADAKAYLLDKNPSSALKRYTNMAVCWKCHSAVEGKSSKLMNNSEYWTNYSTNPLGGNNSVYGYEPNWLNGNPGE